VKPVAKPDDIVLSTQRFTDVPEAKLAVDGPGEYEVSGVSIVGVTARAHMDEVGVTSATMYKVDAEDVRVAVVGHVHPDLTADELEALGTVDVLIIPVGGSGYTLDGIGALKVVKAIEPKVVIPTHYADKALSYEVPPAVARGSSEGLRDGAGRQGVQAQTQA
jgi:L-ascorbate metabolism protein UlaG (beta-lactamase superfamily)